MKITNIESHTVTVQLSITDCLALVAAAHTADSASGPDLSLMQALGSALHAAAFGTYLKAENDPPHTIGRMWALWGPIATGLVPLQHCKPPYGVDPDAE